MVLEPLDEDAVTEIAEDVLGAAPETDLLGLAAGAGGNPFLLVELLGGLRDEAAIEWGHGHARLVSERLPQLPRRVQEFARNRLGRLSARTRRLLQVAAVLGRSFSMDDLADLLDEPPEQLLSALEEALTAQILVPHQELLVFRHDLLWQAVTDGIPLPVRRWLHLQAGEVLLKRGGSAIPAAAHFMVHARPGDKRVLAGLDRAAREVLPSSPQTTAELALRALELTDMSDPARFQRTVTAIDALTAAGRLSESTELARAELDGASAAQASRLRHELATVLLLSGRPEDAVTEVENLFAQQGLPDDLRDAAELTWFAGLILQYDFWRGRERAEAIVAAPDRHGIRARNGALVVLMHVAWAEGRIADGFGHIREAARTGRGAIGAYSTGPRLFLAACLLGVRRFEESEDVLRAADAEIEATGHTVQAASTAFIRAYLRLASGRLDDAAAEAETGLEIADELGTHAFTGIGLAVLAIVSLRRGDLLPAVRNIERYHAQGAHGMAFSAGWGTWAAASVAEDRAQAETIVDTIEGLAHDNPDFPAFTHAAAHARAIHDKDATALGQAGAGFRDPWARASAAEDQGILLAGASGGSDHEAAIHSLDQALKGYERIGALRDAARIRARLRRFGVRRRHWARSDRPVTGWDSLTDTEQSVATLVAQGLTNRQVGAQMFVSPHTVKFHLRQVFRKLEIGSRVELARIATAGQRETAPPGGATRGRPA
jgi:DNA-binding CsgD family transcriptional regulator